MKLGNTYFQEGIGKTMTFAQFKKLFPKLRGIDHETAYKELGGKIEKKKQDD